MGHHGLATQTMESTGKNRVPVSETIDSSAIIHEAMDNLIMKKSPVLEKR